MTQIELYLQYLRHERNFSRHTEISYYTDLKQFESFISTFTSQPLNPQSVTPEMIRQWIVFLMKHNISANSISRKLSSVKSFYRYLLEHNMATHNPAQTMKSPKKKKPLPSFANYHQIKPVLEKAWQKAIESDNFEKYRNALMVELMYLTGIRRAELLNIRLSDIDFAKKQILIHGKRKKERIIPISNNLIEKIETYWQIRQMNIEDTNSNLLFVLQTGKPLYPMLLYRIVHHHLCDITHLKKAGPHVLRHSFATSMLNEGAEINAVKELLGHASLASTEVYTHTSIEELKEIYKQAHPHS